MADSMSRLRSMYEDVAWFFDDWNVIVAVIFGLIGVGTFVVGGFTPQSVLVFVTAVYAFLTFNQMRESKLNPRLATPFAVRPHFRQSDCTDDYDFGLKNFGSGPALNLRLKAVLLEGDDTIDTLTISAKDRHLHLEENCFLSLITEIPEEQSFGDLTDVEDSVFANYEQKSIELYYTFEANDGTQYPLGWSKPTDMDMDKVVDLAKSPRTVELAEIREKCA